MNKKIKEIYIKILLYDFIPSNRYYNDNYLLVRLTGSLWDYEVILNPMKAKI